MKSSSNTSVSAPKTRETRLARYCVAGAGAAVLAGTVTTTDASIVYVNYGSQVFNDPAPGNGTYALIPFDIDGNGTFDLQLGVGQGEAFGSAAAIFGPATGTVGVVGAIISSFSYAFRFVASQYDIGPAAGFVTLSAASGRADLAFGGGYPNSRWDTPAEATGIMGVRFTIGAQTVYGWIRMNVSANGAAGRTITMIDAAWQTDGTLIHAGAVPEPSTTALGLVALGAIGLVAHRRRVAAQKAA